MSQRPGRSPGDRFPGGYGDADSPHCEVTISALLQAVAAAAMYSNALRLGGAETAADLLDANCNLLAAQAGVSSPVAREQPRLRRGYAPGSRARTSAGRRRKN